VCTILAVIAIRFCARFCKGDPMITASSWPFIVRQIREPHQTLGSDLHVRLLMPFEPAKCSAETLVLSHRYVDRIVPGTFPHYLTILYLPNCHY
jgi:hypothetical protein